MTAIFKFENLAGESHIKHGISERDTVNFTEFLKNFDVKKYIISKQIHQDKIYFAENVKQSEDISGYDALVTRQKNVTLIVKTADCTPILLYDRKLEIIAAIHAGRRSTELKIAEKVVSTLEKIFGSNPQNIITGIGPSICANCYQIDRKQDIHYDLWQNNKKQLINAGIPAENIELAALCPACNAHDRFYSYRKDNHTSRRTYSFITLNDS